MELIALYPSHIDLKVQYPGGEPAKSGVYTVVDNDEYNMVGYVMVEGSKARESGRSAELVSE